MSLTLAGLTGYIDRDLDADLARWFPDAPRVDVPAETPPIAPFLAKLPAEAATALAAFDRRVRSGDLAYFLDIEDWSYAFDFEDNGCQILDTDYETEIPSEDVWSLGADGGGNYYVVLTDGRVALWFHEEEVIEADTHFDTVDAFVWSLVRYRAIRNGALALADVEADFHSLAQPGVLAPQLGLLATLKATA
ncbi:hypothetical protein [Yinghuangia soli]|uniref:SMI1/KNR4 family protein n=1 Tax=Yinghuangia soli TaxID=2908204 RepID=A0AA41PX90_9ACTN|nr:hypothetical protein [Yinghuangia soli]MCF2526509.1 hypothetical protein [Yinghuangia soli]